ncbi:3-isopropylmalate dehydratase, small subunit [Thermoanaerobacter pseudethanolicus ATCC 33223]|uniref:3-isopropylmalate dehydratase small subunit n=5 Tax=Thermoanaerobacteraceae TaxID=186814 RepID=B0KAH6_THEP3|nr:MULTISPECIES: 3-isopropylmalate dehydratase small subunit [Thermoanaerobacter]ABY93690.1 3-isopropylmalate dehydratase, small subunit [Thermoanaerobacter pseudethanolicus ATCC 33223]ADV78649.1 3-isopropylmalate dehydratase, small subunit [Thermoanaerobacter brockii subsp. finnii Ako-1]EGD52058.1 3-isopropylmalate dehydratase, small subunit [Thermoanaerobacter ethanolicus JW 200]HBW59697.1 3-isopropylmalate dehydratase small subunit [Thermoanaerobacter sp.]EIW00232.1 3-isopropylmalate dehydr
MQGKAIKYGDNIDTDVIIPARYLNTSDPQELAQHCMEDLDKEFKNKVQEGDILVVGENFGSGSSREHAPIAIKASGISCIIAKSFARIFFRNAINIGLPILECKEAVDGIEEGDIVLVDTDNGIIKNLTKGTEFKAQPFPDFIKEIMKYGGLINYVREKV